MGFFKWIGAEEVAPYFKGQFGSTIGDSLSAVYGARHIHTLGERGAFTVSPLALLRTRAMAATYPALSAMFVGEGGDSKCVMGQDSSAIYKGPVSHVIRARKTERLLKPIFGDAEQRAAAEADDDETELTIDPADLALERTVIAMMRLSAAVMMAFELTIHFAYPTYGSDEEEGEETVPEIIEMLGSAIVSRLLAITHCMEEIGSESETAKGRLEEAVRSDKWFPVTRMYLGTWGDEASALSGSVRTAAREKWATVRAALGSERAMIVYGILLRVAAVAAVIGVAFAAQGQDEH